MSPRRSQGYVRQAIWVSLLAVTSCGSLFAQRGAITVPRNLAQLVAQADTVIRGRVLQVRVEPHPQLTNLHTVVVTLRVEDVLKGSPREILTYRQLIWDMRDRYDAAGYRKGQRFLLLLNPITRYGLTSPAGLEQGRFRILSDSSGVEYAVNGHGNAGLLKDVEAQLKKQNISLEPQFARMLAATKAGPVELRQLEALIRQVVGAN
jgi:hypothetical protein